MKTLLTLDAVCLLLALITFLRVLHLRACVQNPDDALGYALDPINLFAVFGQFVFGALFLFLTLAIVVLSLAERRGQPHDSPPVEYE